MKYVKKLLGIIKKMGLDIPPWVFALVLLALMAGVAYYVWRKKNKAASVDPAAAPAEAPKPPPGPPPVPKDRFLSVWKRFLLELPPVVRRSIAQFQPVVVLGGPDSGKSGLITRYTDWQRQARYLFGSHLDDPDLEIYLGSRVVVLELPSAVLNSTSGGVRDALLVLFQRLFRRRTPVAVIALDPFELKRMSADEVRSLADSVRGKINLLSFVRRRPIEVRLALTHLDRLPGFVDLSELVRRHGGQLEFEVPADAEGLELEAELAHQLGELTRLRPTALKELPPVRYRQLVRFLRDAPAALAPVGSFVSALLAPEPLSRQPKLRSIHLTSTEVESPATAPFRAPELKADRLRDPLLPHRLAAVGLGLALVLGLGWAFHRERSAWIPADAALERYAGETGLRQRPELERALRTEIIRFVEQPKIPPFFAAAEGRAARTLARRLRQDFILRELRDALAHPNGARRAVYLGALAHADPDSDLSTALGSEDMRRRWSAAAGLDPQLVADYLSVLPSLDAPEPAPALSSSVWQATPIETFDRFFADVATALEAGRLEGETLADLRSRAGQLKEAVSAVDRSPDVSDLLDGQAAADPSFADLRARLTPYLVELQAPELLDDAERRAELIALLQLVERTRIVQPPSPRRYLELCQWIDQTLDAELQPIPGEGPKGTSLDPRKLEVAARGKLLSGAAWLELTRDHTIRDAVRDYLRRPRGKIPLFFRPGVEHPPLQLNPETLGRFLFGGRARVPGRFTQAALLQDVLPTLECHAKIEARLARVDGKVAKDMEAALRQETEAYAEELDRAMEQFYRAFRIEAGSSSDNLRLVFDRLLRSSSPLTRHLSSAAENVELGAPSPPVRALAEPILERTSELRVLGEVVTSTASGEPAYASYLLLLRQIRDALQPPDPALMVAPDAAAAEPAGLRDRLGPAGRMALDMLTCAPEAKDVAISQWLDDVGMPADLRGPFLAPVRELYAVGRSEIEREMEAIWRFELLADLEPLLLRFPFDPQSADDANPEQLTALLHPITGSLSRKRARFVEPLFARPAGCTTRYRAPVLPTHMRALTTRIRDLAAALWDASGQPKKLELRATPVPFSAVATDDRGSEVKSRLTLTFLASASTTLVNFNQRPFAHRLDVPWTSVHTAQVGIKLLDPVTQDEIYPDPLVESSYWALLRLLKRAERSNQTFTWQVRFRTRDGSGASRRVEVPVGFELQDNPFDVFALRRYATRAIDMSAFGSSSR